jgi:hypothetical protein
MGAGKESPGPEEPSLPLKPPILSEGQAARQGPLFQAAEPALYGARSAAFSALLPGPLIRSPSTRPPKAPPKPLVDPPARLEPKKALAPPIETVLKTGARNLGAQNIGGQNIGGNILGGKTGLFSLTVPQNAAVPKRLGPWRSETERQGPKVV